MLDDVSCCNAAEHSSSFWGIGEGIIMTGFSLACARNVVIICLLLSPAAGDAWAGSPVSPVNTEHGLAVKGYDPVAYFITGKATPGSTQFTATYNGATYRFASADDRDRFVAAPETYAPQYGGYCAIAIALNQIADIDPDEWAIVNNKLYLNNNFFSQSLWSLDKSGYIANGDHNWRLYPKVGSR